VGLAPYRDTPLWGSSYSGASSLALFVRPSLTDRREWAEEAIDQLEIAFPSIIKELEGKLLTGELDARRQQRIALQHAGFTCEADTLGSHGYVYICIYSAVSMGATPDVRNSQS